MLILERDLNLSKQLFMAQVSYLFTVLLTCCTVTNTCSQINTGNLPTTHIFVGSTPCDSFLKTLLQIPAGTICDFIRWDLTMSKGGNDAYSFALNIVYGEAQPNTLGFKGGGEKRSFQGTYTVFNSKNGTPNGEVYRLKTENSFTAISFIKLNDNLFHLLTPAGKLMVSNGGWNYTLSRKEPLTNISSELPALTTSPSLLNDTALQVTFGGRTPCLDFAQQFNLKIGNDCIKLK